MTIKERKAQQLAKIAREIENCRICKRGKLGQAVAGEGNPDADIVFLGEAPGKQEAKTGRPFIGPAGKILRKLINDAGLKEDGVYITSPVKYLPKYVTPTLADIEHGKLHLLRQIKIINPKLIVLLGQTAAQAMLGRKVLFKTEHGTTIKQDGINFFITYHPAAILHNPKLKTELTKDFRKLKRLVNKK